jgi:tRNA G10  N-methylase Trm11
VSADRWAQDQSEVSYYISRLSGSTATIADPFMGIGTILAAAVTLGRNVWGCDVDAQNIPITQATIAAAVEESLSTTDDAMTDEPNP